jgi:hypothetical protein
MDIEGEGVPLRAALAMTSVEVTTWLDDELADNAVEALVAGAAGARPWHNRAPLRSCAAPATFPMAIDRRPPVAGSRRRELGLEDSS